MRLKQLIERMLGAIPSWTCITQGHDPILAGGRLTCRHCLRSRPVVLSVPNYRVTQPKDPDKLAIGAAQRFGAQVVVIDPGGVRITGPRAATAQEVVMAMQMHQVIEQIERRGFIRAD